MKISYSDWQQWSKTYNRLPVICEMDWPDGLPLSWEKFWDEADPYSFVLESGPLADTLMWAYGQPPYCPAQE